MRLLGGGMSFAGGTTKISSPPISKSALRFLGCWCCFCKSSMASLVEIDFDVDTVEGSQEDNKEADIAAAGREKMVP